jgi:hypothetical protein
MSALKTDTGNPGIPGAAFMALAVFLASMVFIALTVYITPDGIYSSLFDDAMISFRYARNIASGIGPYWNPTDRVEGFTNPLWTYFMSAAYLATGSRERLAPLLVQIICAVLISLNCFVFAAFSGKLRSKVIAIDGSSKYPVNTLYLGASLSPVLFYPNIYWSLMGMEIALLTLLSSLLFLLVYEDDLLGNYNEKLSLLRAPLSFLVCAAGQATRPDFLLFPFSIFVVKLLLTRKSERKVPLTIAAAGAIGIVTSSIAIYLWRLHFFGTSLPNTYLLKVKGVNLFTQLISGAAFVMPMILSYLFFIIVLLLILAQAGIHKKPLIASISYFLIVLFYQIRVGGDPWSYWRVFSSSFVLMGFAGFATLLSTNPKLSLAVSLGVKAHAIKGPAFLSISSLLWLSLLVSNIGFIKTDLLQPLRNWQALSVFQVNDNRNNIDTARTLARILPKGSKIGVFWAGTIPYYLSDYYAIDFLGKSDRHIASLPDQGGVSWGGMRTVPGHNKYDLDWTLKNYEPDWIQIAKWGNDDLGKNPAFTESYAYCEEAKGYLKLKYMSHCKPS